MAIVSGKAWWLGCESALVKQNVFRKGFHDIKPHIPPHSDLLPPARLHLLNCTNSCGDRGCVWQVCKYMGLWGILTFKPQQIDQEKVVYTYPVALFSHWKIMSFSYLQESVGGIMLRETIQIQKGQFCMFPLIYGCLCFLSYMDMCRTMLTRRWKVVSKVHRRIDRGNP